MRGQVCVQLPCACWCGLSSRAATPPRLPSVRQKVAWFTIHKSASRTVLSHETKGGGELKVTDLKKNNPYWHMDTSQPICKEYFQQNIKKNKSCDWNHLETHINSRVRIRYPYLQLVNLLDTEVFVTRPLRFPLSANYISILFLLSFKTPHSRIFHRKVCTKTVQSGFFK